MLCKPEKRPEVIVLTFDQSQENTKIWYEYVRFNQHLYRAFPFPRKAWLQVIAVHTTRLVLINTDHSSPRLPYHLKGTGFAPGSPLKKVKIVMT